jgi:hypothetical protein
MCFSEEVVFSDVAGVFQMSGTAWASIDGGVSRVCVFRSTASGQARVIALASNHHYVLNAALSDELDLQHINEAFVGWLDATNAYGLNFHSAGACTAFIMVACRVCCDCALLFYDYGLVGSMLLHCGAAKTLFFCLLVSRSVFWSKCARFAALAHISRIYLYIALKNRLLL